MASTGFKVLASLAAVALEVSASKCCYDDGLTADQCGAASDCDGDGDYCSASADNCKDCDGVFCADEPAPPSPPAPAPAPTPVPTPPVGEAKCCYDDGLTVDQCSTAADCDGASDYCSASGDNCKDCGGVFCAGDSPAPPAPTPVPTPPSGEAKCCYDDGLTTDQCSTAADCDGASDYCSASGDNCQDCGGVFCAGDAIAAAAPVALAADGDGKCCYDKDLTADQCSTASDCETGYCSSSGDTCKDCGGVFCGDAPVPTPPAPTPPAPTPAPPSGEGKCCYDKDLTADQCSAASDCETGYCSSSGDTCKDCGGVFCSDDSAVSVALI